MASAFSSYSAYSFLAILPGILSLLLLLASLYALLQASQGRYLLLLSLCVTTWSLGYSLTFMADSPAEALPWIRLSTAGILLVPAFCYLFNASFLRPTSPPPLIQALLIGIGGLFLGVHLTLDPFVAEVATHDWGFYPVYAPPFLIFMLFFLLITVLVLRESWTAYRKAPPGARRARNRALFFAWLVSFLGGSDFLIGFGCPLPPISFLPVSYFILVSFLLLTRYGMLGFFQRHSLKSILQSTSDSIFLIDTDGTIRETDAGTARMLGHPDPRALVGEPVNALFSEETPLYTGSRLEQLSQDHSPPSVVLALRTRSEGIIPMRVGVSGIFNRRRELLGLVAIGRDIRAEARKESELLRVNRTLQEKVDEVEQGTTELARANQALQASRSAMMNILEDMDESHRNLEIAYRRLEELDRTKDAFLSSVSHELRTPLTSIRSFAEILLLYPDESPETRREFLSIIHKESERLSRLVSDLLDLAKIQSGSLAWQSEEVHAPDMLEGAVQAFSILAREKGLEITSSAEEGLPPLLADRDRIYQVISNLVANAIKFSSKGGKVWLRAERMDGRRSGGQGCDWVMISVSDNGPGIPPEDLPHVFEKFHQAGDTLQDKPQGAGLGLAICREIVQHYGGTIWVESEPNEGSCFSCTFPISARPEQVAHSDTWTQQSYPRRAPAPDDDPVYARLPDAGGGLRSPGNGGSI